MLSGTELPPGTLVDGRYRVGEVLGEGGMAVVYEARHVFIERTVALKVLALDPAREPESAERFLDEARLAARIEHPNVATVHDFGFVETRIGRRPYIAMARLHGHDLAVELRRHGALEPQRAVRLALRALDALGSAHRLGIVHKDLKPENLFLTHPATDEEDLQVLDFGIAGLLHATDRRTAAGQLAGTPQYLAPEYIEGGALSPALDVYQMGLILGEMLTGEPLVDGGTPYEMLRRHCLGHLALPEALREGPLGAVLLRALERAPQDRFADADAMAAALREAEGLDPVPRARIAPARSTRMLPREGSRLPTLELTGPTPMLAEPAAPASSRRSLALALAATLIATSALTLVLVLLLLEPPTSLEPAVQAAPTAPDPEPPPVAPDTPAAPAPAASLPPPPERAPDASAPPPLAAPTALPVPGPAQEAPAASEVTAPAAEPAETAPPAPPEPAEPARKAAPSATRSKARAPSPSFVVIP